MARAASQRRAAGRQLRSAVPRSRHAEWKRPKDRPDPLALLEEQNRTRIPELVPIRWARMLESPFGFLRGAAVVMAHDLVSTPVTGIIVQACGDAHIANFGVFASPERDLLFDVTDFDETLPGPWEWDVKRLATSAVLAGRDAGLSRAAGRDAATAGVRAYRKAIRGFAATTVLDTWYTRVDQQTTKVLLRKRSRAQLERLFASAKGHTSASALPSLTELTRAGDWRIVDHPPVVSHAVVDEHADQLRHLFATYRESLSDDRRLLLDRFTVHDFALKVVGVGSVGTRCFVALLVSDMGEPLFLQIKEADPSVLAPFWATKPVKRQGRRVVTGQRIMQAESDIFLGWAEADDADFYVRQLRDMKASADFATMSRSAFRDYLKLCGWTLARAHARAGSAPQIAGYLGKGDRFDRAVTQFGVRYAEQTVRDHAALRDAVARGQIAAHSA
ncbi:MAG TPA: DUF2252 domain-containing protein [Acidimicrobiia bacterium]|nr:DUF2252 domain-containing protein [Acidimicrobiia bacterium]